MIGRKKEEKVLICMYCGHKQTEFTLECQRCKSHRLEFKDKIVTKGISK